VGKKGNSRTRISGSRLAGRLLIRPAALLPLLVPFCSAMAAGLGGIIPADEDKGRLAVAEGDAVVWFGLACCEVGGTTWALLGLQLAPARGFSATGAEKSGGV
jgi:hypothetical protein